MNEHMAHSILLGQVVLELDVQARHPTLSDTRIKHEEISVGTGIDITESKVKLLIRLEI